MMHHFARCKHRHVCTINTEQHQPQQPQQAPTRPACSCCCTLRQSLRPWSSGPPGGNSCSSRAGQQPSSRRARVLPSSAACCCSFCSAASPSWRLGLGRMRLSAATSPGCSGDAKGVSGGQAVRSSASQTSVAEGTCSSALQKYAALCLQPDMQAPGWPSRDSISCRESGRRHTGCSSCHSRHLITSLSTQVQQACSPAPPVATRIDFQPEVGDTQQTNRPSSSVHYKRPVPQPPPGLATSRR